MDEQTIQTSIMTNPNQVWFPHVLQFRLPAEIDPVLYSEPRFKNPTMVIVDVILEDKPYPNESWQAPTGRSNATFLEVLDSRPAKGDWSKDFWKGVKPTWFRCLCQLENTPK